MNYKLGKTHPDLGNNVTYIESTDNNGVISIIPIDPKNKEYQVYLEWLNEGNTPDPAE